MQNQFSERIAYGRMIQQQAAGYMSSFGSDAGNAAWQDASANGLTDDEKAFRLAVSARVARLLATSQDRKVA